MNIVVGVGAGIAAYKITALVRAFTQAGHEVHVVPTPASLEFVGAATWRALSGSSVHTGVFEAEAGVGHVELARWADVIVVAPATADLLAKFRMGTADDLLTATVLAADVRVVLAPAMHTNMWRNAATQENVAVLRGRGVEVIDPDDGPLSSGDSGAGRLPDPQRIAAHVLSSQTAARPQSLSGMRALVTAGGTREPIDPVRYIGNHSSGKQGIAIARELRRRGAHVTLLCANIEKHLLPTGVDVVETPTAQLMYAQALKRAETSDIAFFVAAVADYRVANASEQKLKKHAGDGLTLNLQQNPDILATVTQGFPHLLTVGFAAETGDPETVLNFGKEKARRKGASLLAINPVGHGRAFGRSDNDVTVVDHDGKLVGSKRGSKEEIAAFIIDAVEDLRGRKHTE
ncbi:bifunctional phosphopantothenoylcysteine decarboxylase/phosphopantothenate--cysteine ligase CoaBC [Gleimia hominis]|uniref:bifunctional phosphopantothenoylcysteine decarboxylase/phosphopantothenate--cysteine ligase CoaBC n=1 Tax=Gleimia hominis TaxID=595468 RepID=UPI000C80272A|nr:bifunctional phosphopantothenoylcysteine decarboxylase/phosphopantothenate--cysteine ligase CoaBC [Gleimia hominis]WIK65086.1 bifunctional phosphopantothenoylcysteine decarboxylase/phosphopantothenate--cysteine ligase CoaBC [Gleimia hominis]